LISSCSRSSCARTLLCGCSDSRGTTVCVVQHNCSGGPSTANRRSQYCCPGRCQSSQTHPSSTARSPADYIYEPMLSSVPDAPVSPGSDTKRLLQVLHVAVAGQHGARSQAAP
jgi:hypothetical protein